MKHNPTCWFLKRQVTILPYGGRRGRIPEPFPPQKLQLGVFGAGTLVFIITYLVAGLLNGFSFVNQWILDNLIPVAAYWFIQIGMIPVYRNVDFRRIKWLKQSIYTFFFSGGPFILFLAYYQVPPADNRDRPPGEQIPATS